MTRTTRLIACTATGLALIGTSTVAGQNEIWTRDGELIVVEAVAAAAQRVGRPTPEGTASLSGRVVAAGTGAPLRQAEVTVLAPERRVRRATLTDADGRYEVEGLPAGTFTIRVEKPGYLTLFHGQRYAYGRGTPVSLADGEQLGGVDLTVPRGSVLAVRVTDDRGEPIAGAAVRVQQFEYRPDGRRRLSSSPAGAAGSGTTDDRGEFRAYGLMPGEYVVGATLAGPSVARVVGASASTDGEDPDDHGRLAPTFYPGTIGLDGATPVSVGVSEERVIQFAMVAARLGRVSGTVVDSRGQPAAGAQIQVATRQGATVRERNAGRVAADGSFTVGDLPPGEHLLTVRTAPGGRTFVRVAEQFEEARAGADGRQIVVATPLVLEPGDDESREREFASFPVVVSGSDVVGLHIVTQPGTDITGTVVVPDGASRPRRLRVRAQAAGDTGNSATSRPLDGETFALSGAAGRVLFDVTLPSGWAVASVTLAGRDITEEPLDLAGRPSLSGVVITLTDDPTIVAGRVAGPDGRPLGDYVVVIQPAQPLADPGATAGRVRALRPDGQGRFTISGLRPGRYLATAIAALQEGREYSPEFRERLRAGAREFVLLPGDDVTLDLPLTRGL